MVIGLELGEKPLHSQVLLAMNPGRPAARGDTLSMKNPGCGNQQTMESGLVQAVHQIQVLAVQTISLIHAMNIHERPRMYVHEGP